MNCSTWEGSIGKLAAHFANEIGISVFESTARPLLLQLICQFDPHRLTHLLLILT